MLNKFMPFRFWCQKVLPLVYDDSLSYVELLYKVVDYLNKMGEDYNALADAFQDLYLYVQNFVDEQVEPLVDAKLEEMVEDGELDEIIARLMSVDYVTPDMYDAVGDGVADDTTAVQSAFNSGKNVCFMKDKTYRITAPIYIDAQYNSYRSCFCKTINNTEYYSIIADFAPNTNYPAIFIVNATAYTFYNVSILGRNQNGSAPDNYKFLTIFLLSRNGLEHNADIDFQMINCNTSNAGVVCDFTGRGCKIDGHVDAGSLSFLKVNWDGDNANTAYHDDYYGQRAISVTNSRFHAQQSSGSLIDVQSGYCFGFRFIGNLIDRGYNNFMRVASDISNWLISDNIIVGERMGANGSALMWFGGDVEDLTISNNKFYNGIERQDTSAFKPTNLIQFGKTNGIHLGVLIYGNTVNKLWNGNFVVASDGTTFYGLNVSGNVIGQILGLTAHRGIVRGSSLVFQKSVVSNNTLNDYTQADGQSGNRVHAIYSTSGLDVHYSKVMGNTLATNFSYPVASTGTETITYSIIDLQSYTT